MALSSSTNASTGQNKELGFAKMMLKQVTGAKLVSNHVGGCLKIENIGFSFAHIVPASFGSIFPSLIAVSLKNVFICCYFASSLQEVKNFCALIITEYK